MFFRFALFSKPLGLIGNQHWGDKHAEVKGVFCLNQVVLYQKKSYFTHPP